MAYSKVLLKANSFTFQKARKLSFFDNYECKF